MNTITKEAGFGGSKWLDGFYDNCHNINGLISMKDLVEKYPDWNYEKKANDAFITGFIKASTGLSSMEELAKRLEFLQPVQKLKNPVEEASQTINPQGFFNEALNKTRSDKVNREMLSGLGSKTEPAKSLFERLGYLLGRHPIVPTSIGVGAGIAGHEAGKLSVKSPIALKHPLTATQALQIDQQKNESNVIPDLSNVIPDLYSRLKGSIKSSPYMYGGGLAAAGGIGGLAYYLNKQKQQQPELNMSNEPGGDENLDES